MRAYDPDKYDLYPIAGDGWEQFDVDSIPEASGPRTMDGLHMPGDGGLISSEMGLKKDRIAEVPVRYKDRVLFIDVYKINNNFAVHLLCPRCLGSLWIDGEKKEIEFDMAKKLLSIEPFGCTYEAGRGTDGTRNDRIMFGVGLCRWTVGISNNRAVDA